MEQTQAISPAHAQKLGNRKGLEHHRHAGYIKHAFKTMSKPPQQARLPER